MATELPARKQRTFLGHPVGLYVLFFTEMWERFSYYGMRALLMLYMVNYFKWTQKDASTTYKIYTSFVYVTPIIGGYLADRYLGNRGAVIIGGILMAIGQFLMTFEDMPIFMGALLFLIIGNGFFKPNMSVQVGRLYAANDGRRDGAYTIFYMGINLGAFLSPLVCGWLMENTVGGYHSGFAMAGIGMLAGLAIYLFGQPFIKELAHDAMIVPAGQVATAPALKGTEIAAEGALPLAESPPSGAALTEAQAAKTPSILGGLSGMVPAFLYLLGGVIFVGALLVIGAVLLAKLPSLHETLGPIEERVGGGDISNLSNMVLAAIGGVCLILMGYVAGQVTGGMRDRVLAILVLAIFVVFFWAAFEQAGNVFTVWADQSTNRYITEPAKAPEVIPEVIEDKAKKGDEVAAREGIVQHLLNLFPNMVTLKHKPGKEGPEKSWSETLLGAFNPMPTTWFQSINALAIFVIAPIFAWLWIFLDRRGWQPSISLKMTLGLLMMSASMAVMLGAAKEENRHTEVAWNAPLPNGISETPTHQLAHAKDGRLEPFHAGRLTWDGQNLAMDGVLDKNECDLLIETTAPESYRKKVEELKKKSEEADFDKVKSVEVALDSLPPGFDMKFAGLKKSLVEFQGQDGKGKLIAHGKLVQKEVKALLLAGGQPDFRVAVHTLYVEGAKFRVSWWWLFWTYILATLGELCLSPVGLSMVSKLAPAKFATMLMGVWMLTSAFGNFAAGATGEVWGTIPPIDFFLWATLIVAGSAVVLFMLVRLLTSAMHGVK